MNLKIRAFLTNLLDKKSSKLESKFNSQKNNLLYVCHGSNTKWNGIGQELYRESEVFNNTIQKYHKISKEKFNFNLLEIYTNKDYKILQKSSSTRVMALASLQMGMIDLWKSKGVYPDAVLGVSLGEVAACYGAGGISFQDAVSVGYYISKTYSYMKEPGVLIYLDITKTQRKNLLNKLKGIIYVTSELSLTRFFIFLRNENLEKVSLFLSNEKLKHRVIEYNSSMHTSIIENSPKKEEVQKFFQTIVHKPLEVDLYSSVYGKVVFAGTTLKPDYWYEAMTKTCLSGQSISNAIQDNYNVLLNIVGNSVLKNTINTSAKMHRKKVVFIPTISLKESEIKTLNTTYNSLVNLNLIDPTKSYSVKHNVDSFSKNSTDLMQLEIIKNPYPFLKETRNYNPVQYFEKHEFWQVLNYDDVDFALKNPEIFSSLPAKGMDSVLLGAEPIDHYRSRKVLAPYFSPNAIKKFSQVIREEAEKILNNISIKELDIVKDYAIPLSEKVIANFIGLKQKEVAEIQSHLGENRYELTYFSELEGCFSKYLDTIHSLDKNTFCTKILQSEGFNKSELTSILKLLWIAGTTTTSMLISSSVLILLENPELVNELKDDFSKMKPFIEEVLRYESPEKTSWRTTIKDVELSGVFIPKNSQVHLCLASANRDPKYFDNPDDFNFNRTGKKKHLAFAAGPHYCIGAELARLEVRIALEVLIEKFPAMKLARPKENISYFKSTHFRALESLPVNLE
ncbi:MAG: hypothetical protein COA67_00650 [Lutibacter sp.]|nr:MAG: hypothetical protein COA67_00650 [Lutibacter sp.]